MSLFLTYLTGHHLPSLKPSLAKSQPHTSASLNGLSGWDAGTQTGQRENNAANFRCTAIWIWLAIWQLISKKKEGFPLQLIVENKCCSYPYNNSGWCACCLPQSTEHSQRPMDGRQCYGLRSSGGKDWHSLTLLAPSFTVRRQETLSECL